MADNKAVIIGAGIGGLALSCLLAKKGLEVDVYEKNEQLGGRCSVLREQGFIFDMGPSWYLMPDVFGHFFELLGKPINNFLDLKRLDPSYKVFFKDEGINIEVRADKKENDALFDSLEPGAAKKMDAYLKKSSEHYRIAMDRFIYKNYDSLFDFFSPELIREGLKLSILAKMQKYVERYFKTDKMQKLLQYQLVFLGNSPYNAPAIYNIMSHVDFDMGVFYPQGGIGKITEAIASVGKELGVKYHLNSPAASITVESGKAKGIVLEDGRTINAGIVISNADIEHTENRLLNKEDRSFSEKYWKQRVLAPSGLVMYLGVKGTIDGLRHHNLVFSKDWRKNFGQIFDRPQWPDDPSFYVCAPGKTDPSVAPAGHENLFVFVPIASDLPDTEAIREKMAYMILMTMEKEMDIPDLRQRLAYKKIFTVNDFKTRYNSFRGSALGLAHTLFQTAVFRPNNVSRKVKGLYYVGGNTNPGIGLPMCLISAELAYKRITGNKSGSRLSSL